MMKLLGQVALSTAKNVACVVFKRPVQFRGVIFRRHGVLPKPEFAGDAAGLFGGVHAFQRIGDIFDRRPGVAVLAMKPITDRREQRREDITGVVEGIVQVTGPEGRFAAVSQRETHQQADARGTEHGGPWILPHAFTAFSERFFRLVADLAGDVACLLAELFGDVLRLIADLSCKLLSRVSGVTIGGGGN